ncbi:hypothetical protein FQN60_012325 [Etheostoma spectabile]|uniref:Uncharacterized protein n=1 Tax=Etheostoma spectabile TaxID=54343 RepID=A0A5J5DPK9_9PERO|nr:hypothetical protein FQN60_012325 [Etheostoma spectabile]
MEKTKEKGEVREQGQKQSGNPYAEQLLVVIHGGLNMGLEDNSLHSCFRAGGFFLQSPDERAALSSLAGRSGKAIALAVHCPTHEIKKDRKRERGEGQKRRPEKLVTRESQESGSSQLENSQRATDR